MALAQQDQEFVCYRSRHLYGLFMIISCINSSDPKDQCHFVHSLGSINMDNGQSDESSGWVSSDIYFG